jgi:hypothetical protein
MLVDIQMKNILNKTDLYLILNPNISRKQNFIVQVNMRKKYFGDGQKVLEHLCSLLLGKSIKPINIEINSSYVFDMFLADVNEFSKLGGSSN